MDIVAKMKLVVKELGYIQQLRCGDIALFRPGRAAPARTLPLALWVGGDRRGFVLITDFDGGTRTIDFKGLSTVDSFRKLKGTLDKLAYSSAHY